MTARSSSFRLCMGSVLLVACISAFFYPVLGFDFVQWDDDINVTQNPLITAPPSWELFGDFFSGEAAQRFKPLHWMVLRAIHDGFGLNPAAFHAVGWAFHSLAAGLLFVTLRKTLHIGFEQEGTRLDVVAWAGAALWAIHPLRVEPVAWVTGSTYPMAAVFLLGSFLAYLRAYDTGAKKNRWLAIAWLGAIAAYATYPVSATYGLWLMAVDKGLLKIAPSPLGDGGKRKLGHGGSSRLFSSGPPSCWSRARSGRAFIHRGSSAMPRPWGLCRGMSEC